ncbi:MAG: DUF3368 domain-containing protein [Pirellulaceae bacterium]
MAVIVSDTSPIRTLCHLGRIDWLQTLFAEVFIPPAVVSELEHPASRLLPILSSAFSHLKIRAPNSPDRVDELLRSLDRGEAEAIALAEEIHADLILMDELDGRETAERLGLAVTGTLGILLRAKQQGLCPEIRPLMDRLQLELNFFVAPALRTLVLHAAGE